VETLSQAYKDGTISGIETAFSLEDSIEKARLILKQKKSARVSMESLLTAIYGKQVSL